MCIERMKSEEANEEWEEEKVLLEIYLVPTNLPDIF